MKSPHLYLCSWNSVREQWVPPPALMWPQNVTSVFSQCACSDAFFLTSLMTVFSFCHTLKTHLHLGQYAPWDCTMLPCAASSCLKYIQHRFSMLTHYFTRDIIARDFIGHLRAISSSFFCNIINIAFHGAFQNEKTFWEVLCPGSCQGHISFTSQLFYEML